MHSRIFQIASAPVSPDEFIAADDFIDHWFTNSIADYVSNDVVREEEMESLRDLLEKREIVTFSNNDSFTILPNGKNIFFWNSYETFLEHVKKASAMFFEDFISPLSSSLIYLIQSSYQDKFGYYVSSSELGTIPFDEFMRVANIGTRYYIGGIVDYHF